MSGPEAAPSLSVVVVLHDSADTIAECVASIPSWAEVVLVDNESNDDGVSVATAVRSDATVVPSPNRGFGAGCNRGAAVATGDVLIFLNPDATFIGESAQLLARAASIEPYGIVGPQLVGRDGQTLHVVRRRRRAIAEVLNALPFSKWFVPSDMRRDVPPSDPIYRTGGDVAYLQGACIAIHSTLFRRLSGFDETFFLYFEEEDLCLRAGGLGARCSYDPDASVRHLWGTSIGKVEGLAAYHLGRSRTIFLRKWFGPRAGTSTAVGVMLANMLRVALLRIRLVFGGDDALDRRMRGTAQHVRGLRDGLKAQSVS